MNNAAMVSPNIAARVFIIFLVWFPVGGPVSCRSSSPYPTPAETGWGTLSVQPLGTAMLKFLKLKQVCLSCQV